MPITALKLLELNSKYHLIENLSERELERIREIANASVVRYIVTTEKDEVRLPPGNKDGIYILKMKMGLKESQKILEDVLCPILVR